VRKLIKDSYAKALSLGGAAWVIAIWVALVMWNFIFMEPRASTTNEIADFYQGLVITLSSDQDVSRTGFWIDDKGYVLTYSRKIEDHVSVGTMRAPLLHGSLISSSGITSTYGKPVYYNSKTGIEIVQVDNNPFIRKERNIALSIEANGEVNMAQEKCWVACLSPDLVRGGEAVFLGAVEYDASGDPAISTKSGMVTRRDNGPVNSPGLRIYTTFPFKRSYLGAPVLDISERLVGIVVGDDGTGNAVLIPTQYVIAAVKEAKPQLTTIAPTVHF
jgi:hypothetical protein